VIVKRGYLDLARQFDESHPTVSAIAPLICFVATFTVLILLRLIGIFGAVSAFCVETDQFWYTSTGGNWPLVGSSFLVVFLLFVWNLLIGFDDWCHSRAARILVVVNSIGIAAMLYSFTAVHNSATFSYNARAGLYENVKFQPFPISPRNSESECATMRRFAGRWQVVDRQVGYYGFNIPAQWIELKPWGYLYAQDASWSRPYAEKWRAPYQIRYSADKRWRDGDLFGAPWDFDLQGDTLILTSPQDWFEYERQRSTVILKREPLPDKPVFPNIHAVAR
jgi:hypothetical protein